METDSDGKEIGKPIPSHDGMSVSTGIVHKNTKYAIYFIPKHGSCHEYPEGCKLFIQ